MMNLDEWLLYARASVASKTHSWRMKSLAGMLLVVERHVAKGGTIDLKQLEYDLRTSYPFGSRANFPYYKAWLAERRKLLASIRVVHATVDEYEVIRIADDLVQLGRVDEAKALLDEQAPNRLARNCPACGVRYGHPCRERVSVSQPEQLVLLAERFEVIATHTQGSLFPVVDKWVDKVIPCEARIIPPTQGTT